MNSPRRKNRKTKLRTTPYSLNASGNLNFTFTPFPYSFLPRKDVKPQLDFYSTLKGPVGGQVPSESTQADTGTEPEGQSEENVSEAYTVQVGALTAEGDARRILLRLTARGYPARMSAPSAEDRYYRVWVGRFETTEQARELERRLREDGFLTYLKKIN